MSHFMGPALPPGFKRKVENESERGVDGGESIGPSLPSSHARSKEDSRIGPQLSTKAASTFRERTKDCHELSDSGPKADLEGSGRECAYGPTLPVDIASGSEIHVYGPSLPPDLDVPQGAPGGEPSDETDDDIGPVLPSAVECQPTGDSVSEELIGPFPMAPGNKEHWELESKRREIESRARSMRTQLTDKGKLANAGKPQREEWMTELPSEIKPLGVGARKFRTAPIDLGDQSVWTDTPADRMRKAQEAQQGRKRPRPGAATAGPGAKEPEYAVTSSRERKVSQQITEYNVSECITCTYETTLMCLLQ